MDTFKPFLEKLVLTSLPMPIPGYIAKCMVNALNNPTNDPEDRLVGAGKVRFNLNPDGSYVNSQKMFVVQDQNGLFYEVTVTPLQEKTK